MLNNRISTVIMFVSALALSSANAAPTFAQFVTEKSSDESFPSIEGLISPSPAESPGHAASVGGPMTVTDVVIDKTDKNAVVARDGAIVEAQRKAFEVLAQKSMSAAEFKAYKMPDSKTIATLVDNFEIKNEQLSATRYVANFTVRFLPDINNYLNIPESLGRTVAAEPPAAEAAATAKPAAETPAVAASATPQTVLVLPYYEDASGKKILWEDPNPWREAWQAAGNSTPDPNLTVTVPLGDLADVSSGDTEAVWKKDFSVVEKSRANYNATEVALAVARAGKGIDLYLYKDGKLERLKSISGKYNDEASYKKAIGRVTDELKAPVAAADASEPPPPTEAMISSPAEKRAAVVDTGGKVVVDVTMSFANYAQWMEAQRRLAEISPPVDIEISSLTKDQAEFTMDYNGGGLSAFKTALAGKGLELGRPTVEVDESVLGSDKPTQKTIYELKLLN